MLLVIVEMPGNQNIKSLTYKATVIGDNHEVEGLNNFNFTISNSKPQFYKFTPANPLVSKYHYSVI